jgi:hypothetical protein
MTYILCLAHYCDTHGPTPLMVTEGIPAACSLCFEDNSLVINGHRRPSAAAESPVAVTDALRGLTLARTVSDSAADFPVQGHGQRPSVGRSHPSAASPAPIPAPTTLDTPPESPRPTFQQPRRDSSYRRTYDETVTKKQGPCDNCAMTLPRRQQPAVTGSNTDSSVYSRSPTLRTRAPAERVFGQSGQASPPTSQSSSDTDGDHDPPRRSRNKRMDLPVSTRDRSSSSTSTMSERPPNHVHYVDYTSTHEPVLPNSFSLLRASCLRALSFETLPRAPTTSSPTTAMGSGMSSFVTTQSAGSAASGGPIFFGDSLAGYTTAYIFRIPDVHARGHKRVYAFLALSTHRERLAMRTFAVISTAFRDLATWIQQLAEAEAERSASSSPINSSLHNGPGYPKPQQSAFDISAAERGGSSFLTGGSGFTRRMGGGMGASAPKARGLAELVGQPDFFIELHKRFVHLLFEVGVTLNG